MNLNKADRKVFLPQREKGTRVREPKKKVKEFQDEVWWRSSLHRASLNPRVSVVAFGATG